MFSLLSDWITSRNYFWWRTAFVSFVTVIDFRLVFTRNSRIFCSHGNPISDLTHLFESMVEFC